MAPRARKKSMKRTIDFTDVEERILAPEGRNRLKVDEVTIEEGEAGDYYKWRFSVATGKKKGAVVYHNTSLAPQSLWSLKRLLDAFNVDTDGELEMDPADFIDAEVDAEIIHTTFGGNDQAKISAFFPVDEEEEEEEEEKPRKKKAAAPAAPPAKRRGRPAKAQEPDDEEEEEEEEEEEPAPKKKRKSPPVEEPEEEDEELTAEDIQSMSQEELQELIEEHELEVNLADLKSLRRMRSAVISAAEKEGVLTE